MVDPDSGRFTYAYDLIGRLKTILNPYGETTTLVYDIADRRIGQLLANGVVTSLSYDDANRLDEVVSRNSSSTLLSSFNYLMDPAGNRTTLTASGSDGFIWSYDKTNQLLTEHRTLSADTFTHTITYDPRGNRLTLNDSTDTLYYGYDNANRLQTVTDTTGTTSYTYDANGNQLTIEEPSGAITTNTWNGENRLIVVEHPDGTETYYRYNGDGLKVAEDHDGTVTLFVYDGNNRLQETDDVGTVEAEFTCIPLPYAEVLSQRRDMDSSFYLPDGIRNVAQLTDDTEVVTDHYSYDAFGNLRTSFGFGTSNSQLYKGQLLSYRDDPHAGPDKETSTHFRNVNSQTGRFTSEDPAADDSNLYRPVGNNPVNVEDPSGLQGLCGIGSYTNVPTEAAAYASEFARESGSPRSAGIRDIPDILHADAVRDIQADGNGVVYSYDIGREDLHSPLTTESWYANIKLQALAIPVAGPSGRMYHSIYAREVREKIASTFFSETTMVSYSKMEQSEPWALKGIMTAAVTEDQYRAGAVVRTMRTNIELKLIDPILQADADARMDQAVTTLNLIPGGGSADIAFGKGWTDGLNDSATILSDLAFFAGAIGSGGRLGATHLRAVRYAELGSHGLAVTAGVRDVVKSEPGAESQILLRSMMFAGALRSIHWNPPSIVGRGSLEAEDLVEIQRISKAYRIDIEVGGSRANGKGRNIASHNLPVDSGVTASRSDIDFIFDLDHPSARDIARELRSVGHGAGSVHPDARRLWNYPDSWEEHGNGFRILVEPNGHASLRRLQ